MNQKLQTCEVVLETGCYLLSHFSMDFYWFYLIAGSTYMDIDENGEGEGDEDGEDAEKSEDNVTEQTHHIIGKSYIFID